MNWIFHIRMIDVSVKDTINSSADKVWNTVGAISNVEQYIPMITSSKVEGSGLGAKRTCVVANEKGEEMGKIEEDIVAFNDEAKMYRYAITSSPFPVENYIGTVKVIEKNDNECELEWSCKCDAKGMKDEEVQNMLRGVYSSIIDGVKKLHSNM